MKPAAPIYIYLILGILVYFIFFYNPKETLDNTIPDTNRITRIHTCEGCGTWNNKDIKSKCDAICLKENPDKYIRAGRNWFKDNNDIKCECRYTGTLKKDYVGCPIKEKLSEYSQQNDCFIWNDKEAQQKCEVMCDKYLPGKNPIWTGNWKNTSSETTACECLYYN